MESYSINNSELEDFKRACNNRPLNVNDFKINGIEIKDIQKQLIKGEVIVSKNGISKSYEPSTWAAMVTIDIEEGIFD